MTASTFLVQVPWGDDRPKHTRACGRLHVAGLAGARGTAKTGYCVAGRTGSRLAQRRPHVPRTSNSAKEQTMGWIVTLVVGGIIGWLASMLMKTDNQMGILGNVIVGIIGSSLGFWLAGVLGFAAYGVIAQWAVAVAGAAVLIFLLKALGIFR
jgi:uncharacterized membrane protein YeaQ/YmgE (transglycosylase-associated protein family)